MSNLEEAKQAIIYQTKQWCKSHILPFNPEMLHSNVPKEEYENLPKNREGMRMTYEVDGKQHYAYYLTNVQELKQEEYKPEVNLVSNVVDSQEKAQEVIQKINFKEVEEYLDKVIVSGGPAMVDFISQLLSHYKPVKKKSVSVARKAKAAKRKVN